MAIVWIILGAVFVVTVYAIDKIGKRKSTAWIATSELAAVKTFAQRHPAVVVALLVCIPVVVGTDSPV